MTNDQPPVWERQPGETSKSYHAFTLYRDLGRGVRTLEKAVKSHKKHTKHTLRTFAGWSSSQNWVKRCEAWDKYEDSKREKSLDELRDELIKAEKDDYELLRKQWLEQSAQVRAVDVKTVTEDGTKVLIIKVTPYEFKAHIEARKRISEGLRLVAELPSSIERKEVGGLDGKDITVRVEYDDYNPKTS